MVLKKAQKIMPVQQRPAPVQNENGLTFVIPTNRLRDVGKTVELYDQHFWDNGHSPLMIVFDDSTVSNQKKYYELLEKTKTHQELYYVGPREKEQFLNYLNSRLQNKPLEAVVKNLFSRSYGGNRNYTLMYTLDGLMISSDDDMRPHCMMENSSQSLNQDEVCRGRLHKATDNDYTLKSFDIAGAFIDVLGEPVIEVPDNYDRGELLVDTAMDLETNTSKGLASENSLVLQRTQIADDAVVKIAQTFRSGTNDIDAIDFLEMFLRDEQQTRIDDPNEVYVLDNFRPVITQKNWRMDCGVAGYDNTFGLPPFFPTRLRFEDYIYRLWIQQDGIVAAHVNAAQHHTKSNYMRNPMASEIFNEEVCSLLKRKIRATVTNIDALTISFDYDGEINSRDAAEMLEKAYNLHAQAASAASQTQSKTRAKALKVFATTLKKAFYGFEPDFFQQNLQRITDEVVSDIKASLAIWPSIVEISYFQKRRSELPITRVNNKKK